MNDYVLSVILGIIEGLTEFLPISSTAHLRLAQKLAESQHWTTINMEDPYWKMYTVVIQLGAILCLPVYFFPRIKQFIRTFPKGERGDRTIFTHPLSLTLIAFVVTAGPSFILTKKIAQHLDNFNVIGLSLLIGGIVMWIVDAIFGKPRLRRGGFDAVTTVIATQSGLSTAAVVENSVTSIPTRLYPTEHMEEMSLPQAIWIGACQILSAVFPGTSRSMSTITAGQLVGMSRASALEFSFFLSMPTMFAATLFALKKAVLPKAGEEGQSFSPARMTSHDWIVLLIGLVVSFIVAFGVVAWFMSWVRRRGFTPFAIYRIVLGIVVLIWVAKGG